MAWTALFTVGFVACTEADTTVPVGPGSVVFPSGDAGAAPDAPDDTDDGGVTSDTEPLTDAADAASGDDSGGSMADAVTGDSQSPDPTDGGGGCVSDAECPDETPVCAPDGTCLVCYPDTYGCEGEISMLCNAVGTLWTPVEDCAAAGETCEPAIGQCVSPCEGGLKLKLTNAGCEFWAVDLRNATESTPAVFLDAQNAPFALIVSNTDSVATAQVVVTMPDGFALEKTIAPESLETFVLPSTWGLTGTGKSMSAYRITSNTTVVAYQFNPLSNVDVFSNDASVLLPVAQLGGEYRVVTLAHSQLGGQPPLPGYVTIVGVEPTPVEVTVTPKASIIGGGEVPAISVGVPSTFTLGQGEVLHLETSSGDLTGTLVTSTGRVAAFAGHVAARTTSACCSDHLEQQLPPVSSWGTEIVMGRSMERHLESDWYRVVAAHDGTYVTLPSGVTPGAVTLNAGEFFQFQADDHIYIEASQPILVAQFLASSGEVALEGPCNTAADCGQAYICEPFTSSSSVSVCQFKPCDLSLPAACGTGYTCLTPLSGLSGPICQPIGDPAMILGVPVAQWQTDFVFLTPDSYIHDYVNIVAPPGATVMLDGVVIAPAAFEAIAGSEYQVYRVEVVDGVHIIEAEAPVSVVVYGYDGRVSYGYPGAMGLKNLE